MKKTIISLLFFQAFFSIAQNKKEQIQILSKRIDSCKIVIQTRDENIIKIEKELSLKKDTILSLRDDLTSLNNKNNLLKNEKDSLKLLLACYLKKNDSISNVCNLLKDKIKLDLNEFEYNYFTPYYPIPVYLDSLKKKNRLF